MATPKRPDIPPFVIFHLVRHAKSVDGSKGPDDAPLTYEGERQCDDLANTLRSHEGYITHIFTSPMKRCTQTAHLSFRTFRNQGVDPQIMTALRGGGTPSQREGDQDADIRGPWIRNNGRDQAAVEFVRNHLTLKKITGSSAARVKEIVLVTQGGFLRRLLEDAYRRDQFPNAKMRSYWIATNGSSRALNPILTHDTLSQKRKELALWADAQKQKDSYSVDDRQALLDKELQLHGESAKHNKHKKVLQGTKKAEVMKNSGAENQDPKVANQPILKLPNARDVREARALEKIWAERLIKKKEREEKEKAAAKLKECSLKRALRLEQTSLQIVDDETDTIVTLVEYAALLKIRHRKEFVEEQRLQREAEKAKPRDIAPLKRKTPATGYMVTGSQDLKRAKEDPKKAKAVAKTAEKTPKKAKNVTFAPGTAWGAEVKPTTR